MKTFGMSIAMILKLIMILIIRKKKSILIIIMTKKLSGRISVKIIKM